MLILAPLVALCGAKLVSAVFGPIATDRPAPAGGNVVCSDPPLASFFIGHAPPYPTDDWWVGYGVAPGNAVSAGPFPYESNMNGSSFQFGVSTSRDFDGTSIHQSTQTDWSIGFTQHNGDFANHKALSWDTQTVQVQYFTGSSTMTAYLVPGSPYLTFDFANSTPLLTSGQGPITSFTGTAVTAGGAAVSSTGTKFSVVNSIGTYLIYALGGSLTLQAKSTANGGTITATGPYNGVIRVVKLNQTSHKTILDEYYQTYPTGVTTDYSFNGDTATLSFTWNVVGTASDLLMLTWPHHRTAMTNPNFPATTALSYLTTKGYMYPALGNVWEFSYALSTITWNPPRPADSSCASSIIQGLQHEISAYSPSAPSVPGDFYYWGGAISAAGRLALIAEHMGQTQLINNIVKYMENSYAYWFETGQSTAAGYETGWGGIVDAAGATNVNIDFGNGFYNDHHFHYGYFLTGAAIIAKYDSAWMNAHKTQVNWFLRDIINPSYSDPYFTPTRHRDWFAGHSWASGIANGAGSRDQESTGEGINAYYGAMLWASVTGQTDAYNYARLLLATEQHGAQTYWHMYPSMSPTARDNPYPEASVRALVTIGNVEDWQSGAWLFWGAETVEIAAIQILPVTPIGEYTYDSEWVQAMYQYTYPELIDPSYDGEWKCVIYDAYANYDPQTAALMSTNLTDWGTGSSYTNTLHFIATRPNPSGQPICANAPSNPQGVYTLKSVDNGLYVTSSTSNLNLAANAASASAATSYNFTWAPNAGNVFALNNQMFVTADQSGTDPLSAARATASSWEQFIVRQKPGAATGVYTILAAANGMYITLGANGALINGGTSASSAAGFTIGGAANPQGAFVLKSASSGLYVSSTATNTNLYANQGSLAGATVYGLTGQNVFDTATAMYASADIGGAIPLSASRATASTWEDFTFLPAATAGVYTIQCTSNGLWVSVQADGSLVNKAASASAATGFYLEAPPNPSGLYQLKAASTGDWVVATAANPNLIASSTAQSSATVFNLTVLSTGGGNIWAMSNSQFVTADQAGTVPLSAARTVASTWEVFTILPKSGAGAGIYSILCNSNGEYVILNGSGELVNGGTSEAASAGFQLVAAS